jgi:hypothetical protein
MRSNFVRKTGQKAPPRRGGEGLSFFLILQLARLSLVEHNYPLVNPPRRVDKQVEALFLLPRKRQSHLLFLRIKQGDFESVSFP